MNFDTWQIIATTPAEPMLHPAPTLPSASCVYARLPTPEKLRRRLMGTFGPLLAALALAACQSTQERVAEAEAGYQAAMSVGNYERAREYVQEALDLSEDDPNNWMRLGQAELALGNLQAAYNALRRTLELRPDNVEVLTVVARLALQIGDMAAASEVADTLLLLQPDNAAGLLVRATAEARLKNFDVAIGILDRILANDPDNLDAVMIKSQLLVQRGKPQESLAMLAPHVGGTNASAPIVDQMLRLQRESDNVEGQLETYPRLISLRPDDIPLRVEYGTLLWKVGRREDAMAAIAEATSRAGQSPGSLTEIANFWKLNAPPEMAIPELQKLVVPGRRVLATVLGTYLIDLGRYAEGQQVLRPLVSGERVESITADAEVAYARADLAQGRGRAGKARLDRVLAFDEGHADALLLRAKLALAVGDLDNALADAQAASRQDVQSVEAALLIARVRKARGEERMADVAYAAALTRFPKDFTALRVRVDYLLANKRLPDAINAVNNFLDSSPASLPGWALMAKLCRQSGDARCTAEAASQIAGIRSGRISDKGVPALGGGTTPRGMAATL